MGPASVGVLGRDPTVMGDQSIDEIDRGKHSLRGLYPMALLDSLLWRLALLRAFDESFPHQSLLLPVRCDRDLADFAFTESGYVVGGGFKVEDRFLDVGGELGEVDDLRYAGTGDAGGTGDLGLVFHLSGGE